MRYVVAILVLCLTTVNQGFAQCTTGGAVWLNGENNGQMMDTGLLGNTVMVEAVTSGTMVSGRPLYSVGNSTWKGLNYASLQVARAYSSPGSNRTSFKLSQPLDSTFFHVRVDNIRGDLFNWESQNVRGYLNGVEVPADFKDPVNGATVSGNTISGASYTTSTVQSAMRVFFQGPVDSIVVRQTSVGDWIIAELQVACNVVLPATPLRWYARDRGQQVELGWEVLTETNTRNYSLQYSANGKTFTEIALVPAQGMQHYQFVHPGPSPGKAYYRIAIQQKNGADLYSGVKMVYITPVGSGSIYPNPVKGWLQLDLSSSHHQVRFIRMDGQLAYQCSVRGHAQVNTESWARGMYMVVVTSGEQTTVSRIIVQ